MSNYTTELRFICETFAGEDESKGYNSINDIIAKARPRIFNFSYPIFDSAYKPTLETKIIKHYYTREICAETYARWKLFLDARLNEIMPKYNKLYESELLKFNPLYDADYTREGNRDTETLLDDTQVTTTDMTNLQTDNRKSVTTLSGQDETIISSEDGGTQRDYRTNEPVVDQWTYYNDTPQGGVDGMHLSNNNYLTNATHVTSTGEGSVDENTTTFGKTNDTTNTTDYGRVSNTNDTGTTKNDTDGTVTADRDSKGNTNEDYAEHVIGKFPGKSYSKLLQEFRETFLNIDLMIIDELSDLFFGLWE